MERLCLWVSLRALTLDGYEPGEEALSQLILFAERFLGHALIEDMTHYHQGRPHQGMGNIVLGLPIARHMMYLGAIGNRLAGSCNTDTAKPHKYVACTGHGDIMEMRDGRRAGHIFHKGCGALRDDRRAYFGGLAGRLRVERSDSTGTASRPARTDNHCGQYPVYGNGFGLHRASERLFRE
jgi:hypothetical protein